MAPKRMNAEAALVSAKQRFWSKVDKAGPIVRPELGPCWLWTAGSTAAGYGVIAMFGPERRKNYTHRFSWELEHGEIPAGLLVCHDCDVKRCVRPSHLFLGTNHENVLDAVSKGLWTRGEQQGASKLTEADVRSIRAERKMGVLHKTLAKKYGVNPSIVSRILSGLLWKHVT